MNPFKVGDRVEVKPGAPFTITVPGSVGTIKEISGKNMNINFDKYGSWWMDNQEYLYLLQADGEKSVKEDVSSDTHKTKEDKGWGF